MYAVKRVEGLRDGKVVSFGTGWALRLPIEGTDRSLEMLVTNRHVVEGMSHVRILFHTANLGKLDGSKVYLTVPSDLIVVGSPDLDVALILFGRELNDWIAANPDRNLFWVPLEEQNFIDAETERGLDVCEPVLMVGCPSGLWDEANGLPLFRRGVTASHPAIEFDGRPEFAVDIGVYSGSSGSPIFLFEQGLIRNGKSSLNFSPGQRFALLGMLWGGPRISESGELSVEPVPTDTRVSITTGVRMHLGYAIKAKEILALAKEVRDAVRQDLLK